MISFLPTQCMIFSIRFVMQSAKDFHPCKPIQKAATSHAKQKRQEFPLYRLMFIFCQRRRHDCCRTFSLLKSVHGIISPVSNLLAAASTKNKAEEFPPIPLDVYFFPTQTARLPQGVFSTRICALNYFTSVEPIRKAATSHAKQKRQRFHPYRLMFILSNADDTTSTRRFFYSNLCIELFRQCGLIPIMQSSNAKQKRQGFTRICASNRSASADNSNLANLSGKLLHLTQNKSGTVFTHTA